MVCGDQRKSLSLPILVLQVPPFKIGSCPICIVNETHDVITPNSVSPEFGDFIWDCTRPGKRLNLCGSVYKEIAAKASVMPSKFEILEIDSYKCYYKIMKEDVAVTPFYAYT